MGKRRKPKHNYVFVEETPSYYHTSRFGLEIRNSQIKQAGLGLFTNETILENTLIDYYTGRKQRLQTSNYFFEITTEVVIVVILQGLAVALFVFEWLLIGSYAFCYWIEHPFIEQFKVNKAVPW